MLVKLLVKDEQTNVAERCRNEEKKVFKLVKKKHLKEETVLERLLQNFD